MKYFAYNKITIHPKYIIITPHYVYDTEPNFKRDNIENITSKSFNQYTGELSAESIKKIRYAINLLYLLAKPKKVLNPVTNKYYTFKINFITLTLPSLQLSLSDKVIKGKILNNFLIQLKNKYGVNNYIWKAETQANGNIHFHITTDTYIEHQNVKNLWNNCLRNTNLINEFKLLHNHEHPNSTDIHAVKNIKNLEAYLIKYFIKNETDRRKIEGKIWGCSTTLNYSNRLFIDNPDIVNEIGTYITENYHKTAIEKDYCTIYPVTIQEIRATRNNPIIKYINSWLESLK